MPTVRIARRDDLARLVVIYNHYVEHSAATFDTEPVSVESRIAWFDSFSDTGPHRLVEFGIYLDPTSRGGGVGSALYGSLLEQISSADVHRAVAGIALPNDASVALHRKFGFTDVGTFDEYATKRGAYVSSLWMQRRL